MFRDRDQHGKVCRGVAVAKRQDSTGTDRCCRTKRCAPSPSVLHYNLAVSSGILVVSLESNGPAERAGLKEGDVIVAYGKHPVSSIDDLHRLLTEEQVGAKVGLTVLRGGEKKILEVVPEESERSQQAAR